MNRILRIFCLFVVATFSTGAHATDYIAWLAVRYKNGAVKTFIQGPYDTAERCNKLNQITWDNVLTSCGACKVEDQLCVLAEQITGPFAKGMRKEATAVPYVIATPKSRIFVSGMPTSEAVAECQRIAANFRSNGYKDSICVLAQ